MQGVLVCGEALFDVFVAPGPGPRLAGELVAGGSPFNVAIGLARLGAGSALFAGLSRDRFGEILRETLIREGVAIDHLRLRANPTTLGVVATGGDGQPRYAFYGEGAADRALTATDLPGDLGACPAIAMGSYTLIVSPIAEALLALARREGARRVISLDPNLRPSLIGDVTAWPAAFARFVRHACIVKASDEDIAVAFSGQATPAEAARRWLELGALLVVVTRGAKGATAFMPGVTLELPARAVAVVDTVGAGDSFHAALLAELARRGRLSREGLASLQEEELAAVLAFALAASALTCARRGADLPTRAEVEAFLATPA